MVFAGPAPARLGVVLPGQRRDGLQYDQLPRRARNPLPSRPRTRAPWRCRPTGARSTRRSSNRATPPLGADGRPRPRGHRPGWACARSCRRTSSATPTVPTAARTRHPTLATAFAPPLRRGLPAPPPVALIVKRDAGRRWRDDNGPRLDRLRARAAGRALRPDAGLGPPRPRCGGDRPPRRAR